MTLKLYPDAQAFLIALESIRSLKTELDKLDLPDFKVDDSPVPKLPELSLELPEAPDFEWIERPMDLHKRNALVAEELAASAMAAINLGQEEDLTALIRFCQTGKYE